MLWYKGWLETRIRLVVTLGMVAFFLLFMHAHPPHDASSLIVITWIPTTSVIWICGFLAGSGIVTQPAFTATKGIHGSTLFTLTLPVGRLRLLAVRAFIGWAESVAAISAFCYGVWLLNPTLRAAAGSLAMIEFTGMLVAAASTLYFVSVLLATFLDDQWRIWCTMLAPFPLWWLTSRIPLPAFADILRALRDSSPLITHIMPWPTVAFSLTLSTILFLAALKVVQTREY